MNRTLNNQETKTYLCHTIDRLQTFLKQNKRTPNVWTLTQYIYNLNYFKGFANEYHQHVV